MAATGTDIEPFLIESGVRVVACEAERAIVLQLPSPELENHVGVRHASALHAAGYAAARALAGAALAAADLDADLRLHGSEIAYKSMGLGELETVAEPAGDGWRSELAQLGRGDAVTLACAVTTSNDRGRAVAELTVEWLAAPRG